MVKECMKHINRKITGKTGAITTKKESKEDGIDFKLNNI